MMAKLLIILLVAGVLSVVNAADSEGFRDLKWGDTPEVLGKQAVGSEKDAKFKTSSYTRKNDKLEIGAAKLDSLSYNFFDNKFERVFIRFTGYQNFTVLKDALESKYGSSSRPNRFLETYYWFGGNTTIAFSIDTIGRNGYIMMWNNEIHDQKEAYKKNVSSQGASDL